MSTRPTRLGATALTTVLTTLAFLVSLAAPSLAAPPTSHQNFYPQGGTKDAPSTLPPAPVIRFNVISDKNDGVNQRAHLTVVATSDTTIVQWYFCTAGYTGNVITNGTVAPQCGFIGQDASPAGPGAPTGVTADEAYGLQWDIPAVLDGRTKDIDSLACNGTPTTSEPGGNCLKRISSSIFLDDAATNASQGGTIKQTTAGEIIAPAHGTNVSNTGFTATARTSAELNAVQFCLASPADATTNPAAFDVCQTDGTPDAVSGNVYKEWSVQFAAADVADNSEIMIAIADADDGSFESDAANCDAGGDSTSCAMDAHYVVSEAPTPTTAVVHFPNQGGSTCEQPTRSATNEPGTDEAVQGCILDQFGNRITAGREFAFELTPDADNGDPGFKSSEGTRHDDNANGFFERVDGDACTQLSTTNCANQDSANNAADATLNIAAVGSYTVTFCYDANNDAHCTTGDSSGDILDTATKNVQNPPPPTATTAVVHFAGQSGSTCESPTTSTTSGTGQTVGVQGCIFDQYGNRLTNSSDWVFVLLPEDGGQGFTGGEGTLRDGNTNGFFEHVLGNPGDADSISNNNAADTAEQVTSAGSYTIKFCYDSNNDNSCASETVVATATDHVVERCPGHQNDVRPQIVGTSGSDTLTGTSAGEIICGLGGRDTLAGRGGDDVVLGGDGADTVRGGAGSDRLKGGRGNDILYARDGEPDTVRGGDGFDRAKVDAVDDTTGVEQTL